MWYEYSYYTSNLTVHRSLSTTETQRRVTITLRFMVVVIFTWLLLLVFGSLATYSQHSHTLTMAAIVVQSLLNMLLEGLNAAIVATL